ncbi:MAG: glycosyltransferase [Candidatus Coatesbacteria bacterium]
MKPALSVVIATRDRMDEITRCLRAVRTAARAARVQVEVIVVDDGSRDGTAGRLREIAREWGARLPLRPVRLPQSRGPAGARNAGVAAARAPWVVFTDSDCRPAPGWLAAYAKAIARHPEAILLEGPVRPEGAAHADVYSHVVANVRGGQGLTSNLAVRADTFRRLGGLDERFNHPHCREDTDFYFTVLEQEATVPFVPAAAVFHPVKRGKPGLFLRESRYCLHEPLLFCRHPRLYLTRLKWIDGWAIPAYHLGFHAAALWGILVLAGAVPAAKASAIGIPALAAASLAATLYALLRRRRASAGEVVLLTAESLVAPFLRLWWTAVGAGRVTGILLTGKLFVSGGSAGGASRTRGHRPR